MNMYIIAAIVVAIVGGLRWFFSSPLYNKLQIKNYQSILNSDPPEHIKPKIRKDICTLQEGLRQHKKCKIDRARSRLECAASSREHMKLRQQLEKLMK